MNRRLEFFFFSTKKWSYIIIVFLYVPRTKKQKPRFGKDHAVDACKGAGSQNRRTEGSDRIAAAPSLTFDPIEETLSKEPSIEAELDEFWPCAEKQG